MTKLRPEDRTVDVGLNVVDENHRDISKRVTVRVGDTVWTYNAKRVTITAISPGGQIAYQTLRSGRPDYVGYGSSFTTEPSECVAKQLQRIGDYSKRVLAANDAVREEEQRLDAMIKRIRAEQAKDGT